jgi:hypothetical protein
MSAEMSYDRTLRTCCFSQRGYPHKPDCSGPLTLARCPRCATKCEGMSVCAKCGLELLPQSPTRPTVVPTSVVARTGGPNPAPAKPTWEPCPRCHSSRVKITGTAERTIMGIFLALAGVPVGGLLMAFVGPFGTLIGVGVAIVGILQTLFGWTLGRRGECKDCKHRWQVDA